MATVQSDRNAVKRAAANPLLELLERLGYLVRGTLGLTILIGLVAIVVALGQFLEAYKANFAKDLKGAEMSQSERTWAIRFGRFGMFARGVTFLVIGWFVVQAGIHHDPTRPRPKASGARSCSCWASPLGASCWASSPLGLWRSAFILWPTPAGSG